jgi:peptide/nickel transport system permease protein
MLNNKWTRISIIIILILVFLAVFADLLTSINGVDPYSFDASTLDGLGVPKAGPSWAHWLGTEPKTGRDLFALIAFGARTSLIVGVGATILDIFVGLIIGLLAGFFGGLLDTLLSKFIDVILLFPGLIFMISIRAIIPDDFPNELLMILVIGLLGWGSIARVVRNETIGLKNNEFVTSAIALGASKFNILTKHIFPNLVNTIIIFATMSIPGMIGSEAALSYLGVGVNPPTPSWGRLISESVNWISIDPWYLAFPGMCLFLITLSFNIFGENLQNHFNRNTTLEPPHEEKIDTVIERNRPTSDGLVSIGIGVDQSNERLIGVSIHSVIPAQAGISQAKCNSKPVLMRVSTGGINV